MSTGTQVVGVEFVEAGSGKAQAIGRDLDFEFVGSEGGQHMTDQGSGTAMNQLSFFSFSIGERSSRAWRLSLQNDMLSEPPGGTPRGRSDRRSVAPFRSQRATQDEISARPPRRESSGQSSARSSPSGSAPSLAPDGAKDGAEPEGLARRGLRTVRSPLVSFCSHRDRKLNHWLLALW